MAWRRIRRAINVWRSMQWRGNGWRGLSICRLLNINRIMAMKRLLGNDEIMT